MGQEVEIKNEKGEVVNKFIKLTLNEIRHTIHLSIACLILMVLMIGAVFHTSLTFTDKYTVWVVISSVTTITTLSNLKNTKYAKALVDKLLLHTYILGIIGVYIGQVIWGFGLPIMYASLSIHSGCYVYLIYMYFVMKPVDINQK